MKKLFKWGYRYTPYIFVSLILVVVLQYLYSHIPIYVLYALKVLGYEGNNVNLPQPILNFLNSLARNTNEEKIKVVLCVAIMIIVLQAVRSLMRFADNYIRGKVSENISRDMRISLYDHIQDLSYQYHNNVDTGDLIQRCTSDIDTSSTFISNKIPEIVSIIATILIGAYQVGKINIQLMWISLVIVPICGISSVIYFRYVNKKFLEIEESEAKMTTIIQENIAQARVVKAFANEKYEFDKMDAQSIDYREKDRKFSRTMGLFWGSQDCAVMLQYVLTLWVGINLSKQGVVDGADIAACILLMGMLVFPIRGLGRIIADFGRSLVASERIDEILRTPSEYEINGNEKPNIQGAIEFKDVCFKFNDSDSQLLDHVSFNIKKGQTVAIIGKTGSGKSTICNLLTRMLEYDSGSILIDGVDIKNIDKKYLRKNVGMVLQEPFLFSKTIYENIAISSNKEPKLIFEAASKAAIHEDIEQFELGYKTLVGEKGSTLSGGQKQRLAIARMLVEDRPVIIFDDSLSAVDTQTDLMIRTALTNKEKRSTMIIVTHRTTTAKEADLIIVLDSGKVAQIGTHDELVNQEGIYSHLWKIQGNLEDEFNDIVKKEEK